MLIKATNHNNTIIDIRIEFDENGNLYFINMENNNTYQININNKNLPYAEPGNYIIIEEPKIIKFEPLGNETSESKINEILQSNVDNEVDFTDDEQIIRYMPERQIDEEIEDDEDDEDDEDKEYYIYQNGDKINICNRQYGLYPALYDTYIYDNDYLIFKSINIKNASSYIIKINNNRISFRSIGDTDKYFKVEINKEEILFTNFG
jgi:hypothetical protein